MNFAFLENFTFGTLRGAPSLTIHGLFQIDQIVEKLSDCSTLGSPYDISSNSRGLDNVLVSQPKIF